MTGSITQWLPPPDANGPVTCDTCGCRLVVTELETWHHFPSLHPGQDARGCRPACVDAEHDRHGRTLQQDVVAAA
jgi:hypothetical protein